MAVYVDDMYKYRMGRFRGYRMSHMIADSHEELMDMANQLGLKVEWLQHEGTPKEHFDIPVHKRAQAIRLGAKAVGMKELVRIIRSKRLAERSDPTKQILL